MRSPLVNSPNSAQYILSRQRSTTSKSSRWRKSRAESSRLSSSEIKLLDPDQIEKHRFTTAIQSDIQITLEHISQFVRLTAEIQQPGSTEQLTIPLVIRRDSTIEQLAQYIEAQYAFMFLESSVTNSMEDPQRLVTSLHVIVVHDRSGVPLKFDSLVEHVLDSGDKIKVHAFFSGVEGAARLEEIVNRRLAIQKEIPRAHNPPNQWPKELESQFLLVLHNQVTLELFEKFCRQLEEQDAWNFWLDVEVFRTGVLHDSEDLLSVVHTDPNYSTYIMLARYIYVSYLSPNAQKKINVPSDFVGAVTWPLPQLDPISGVQKPLDATMFDLIQERIFAYLLKFVFPKFILTEELKHFASSFALPTEKPAQNWIGAGQHFSLYGKDNETIKKTLETALNNDSEIMRTFLPPPNTSRVRSSVSLDAPEDEAYYGNGSRITSAQMVRRKLREAKLNKFFGEVPKVPFKVSDTKADTKEVSKTDSSESGTDKGNSEETIIPKHRNSESKKSASFHVQISDSSIDPGLSQTETDSVINFDCASSISSLLPDPQFNRKLKLHEFFGVDSIPVELLFEEKVRSNITEELEPEDSRPSTMNLLLPEVKKRIVQTNKKLKNLLGENVNAAEFSNTAYLSQAETAISPTLDASVPKILEESNESNDSLNGSSKENKEKNYRRKKLQKIREFLGENIPNSAVSTPNQNAAQNPTASASDKQSYIRRANKLQSMLGDLPPPDLRNAINVQNRDIDGPLNEADSMALLTHLLNHRGQMEKLVKILDDFEQSEKTDTETSGKHSDVSPYSSAQSVDRSRSMSQELNTKSRQIKTIGKLTRFFGSPAGQITSEISRLVVLEQHLEDVIDTSVWNRVVANHSMKQEDDQN